MFTIQEAASRAGLSPDVLRAWERRYRVVRPARTPSGYRLYSEADISTLQAMQRLIDSGFKAREAARYLARNPRAAQSAEQLPGAVADAGASRVPTSAPLPRMRHAAAASASGSQLIAAAASLDAAALSAYFDALSARGAFESACEEALFPAFRALGEAWADGRVSVAGEHAASAAALRWLGVQYRAAARDVRPPQVLVALPPGGHHELGALAHAVALRRRGVEALYLGPDLPVGDLVVAARTTKAQVVVLGVVIAGDVVAAERAAAALGEASSGVRLAFGGPRAADVAVQGAVLPADLVAAVSAVLGMLAGQVGADT
ncbi:MAG: MerR family transcriptional regulator [Deinococcales bacterium]